MRFWHNCAVGRMTDDLRVVLRLVRQFVDPQTDDLQIGCSLPMVIIYHVTNSKLTDDLLILDVHTTFLVINTWPPVQGSRNLLG